MDGELVAAIEEAIRTAFPDRGDRILVEVRAWIDEAPAYPSDYPLACFVCGRKRSVVGVAGGHERAFFGRVGGWDEAGGVRWLCELCVDRADARAKDASPLDTDAILADALRAVASALGDDSPAMAALRAGHAADQRFWSRDGECTCCQRRVRVHGTSEEAMCGGCATAARLAIAKGSASREPDS